MKRSPDLLNRLGTPRFLSQYFFRYTNSPAKGHKKYEMVRVDLIQKTRIGDGKICFRRALFEATVSNITGLGTLYQMKLVMCG